MLFPLLLGTIAGYLFYPVLVEHTMRLLPESLKPLQRLSLSEGFLTRLRYSLILGMLLITPVALWQLITFFSPGLTRDRLRWLVGGLIAGAVLFLVGMLYGSQTVLPVCLKLFQEPAFQPKGTVTVLQFIPTLDFILHVLLALGMVFELPLALFILMGLGVLQRKTLVESGRYATVLAFILAAVISPPDPFSQIIIAVPLIILFYLALAMASIFRLGEETCSE